jgi:predicted metal-dependent enzyme (double-stranded beta helix superfamily)
MSDHPRDRDLDVAELRDLVTDLAARPERWGELVAPDPGRRVYVQLIDDEHVNAWVICWMDDQDTGFHDHDLSAGAVAVVSGAVREERLVLGGPPTGTRVEEGAVFAFAAADIHRVLHAGDGPAVTVHAYSPPLRRMGQYEIDDLGRVKRHSLPPDEELRPVITA